MVETGRRGEPPATSTILFINFCREEGEDGEAPHFHCCPQPLQLLYLSCFQEMPLPFAFLPLLSRKRKENIIGNSISSPVRRRGVTLGIMFPLIMLLERGYFGRERER